MAIGLKRLLTGLAVGTALTVAATTAFAGPYDKYKGTTLVVNFPSHPH
jgi:multiple sugar transport system substrate-binding protein